MSQPAYINKILEKFYFSKANTANFSMKELILGTLRTEETKKALLLEKKKYQGMIGSLMFSIVEIRPDITHATFLVSHFVKNLSYQYTKAVKTIFQYLKRSRNYRIIYGGDKKLCVRGYIDFDLANDKESQKLTSGFIFMLNGGPVSQCSKHQLMVVLSSIDTKYMVFTLAVKEATWL